jgi:hypothetical protein
MDAPEGGSLSIPTVNLWMRYESQHARAFHKCHTQLLKAIAEREKQRIGSVSQIRKSEVHALCLEYRQLRNQLLKSRLRPSSNPELSEIPPVPAQMAA